MALIEKLSCPRDITPDYRKLRKSEFPYIIYVAHVRCARDQSPYAGPRARASPARVTR
jgi:hypothetical protein